MPFPERFYRNVPHSAPQYTSESAGNRLDPSRILWTSAFYERSAISRRKVPKTLVIAEWRLACWTPQERFRFREGVRRLLGEGFTVMLWLDEALPVTLTPDTLHMIDSEYVLSNTCLTHPDKVKEEAVQLLGISEEHLFVLDSREVDCVIERREMPQPLVLKATMQTCYPYFKHVSSVEQMWETRSFELLFEYYKSGGLSFEKISLLPDWNFSRPFIEYLGADYQQFSALPSSNEFEVVLNNSIPDSDTLTALRVLDSKRFTPLSLVPTDGDFPQGGEAQAQECHLPALQYLELIHASVTPQVFFHLTKSPELKYLSIDNENRFSSAMMIFQDFSDSHFRQLETLSIMSCDSPVNKLLNSASRTLCHLKLSDVYVLRNCPEVADCVELRQLESFEWHDHDDFDEPPGLQVLLPIMPNLQRLRITSGLWYNALEAVSTPFNHLRELSISGSNTARESLRNYLLKAPNLRKLSLENIICTDKGIPDMPMLEELELVFSPNVFPPEKIVDTVICLLRKTPNISRLKLYLGDATSTAKMHEEMIPNRLVRLQTLVLGGAVNRRILTVMNSLMPVLKFLDLRGCRHDDSMLSWNIPSSCRVLLPKKTADDALFSGLSTMAPPVPEGAPVHDALEKETFKPTDISRFAFEYTGERRSLNQQMVIEKLSQFMTLEKKDRALIARLQDGICNALTIRFLHDAGWQERLLQIRAWNGQSLTLNEGLRATFSTLLEVVKRVYFASTKVSSPKHFLGDSAKDFLEGVSEACLLENPWHSIALRPKGEHQFEVYDPNHPTGVILVNRASLHAAVSLHLGPLVSVVGTFTHLPASRMASAAEFIKEGGLLTLHHSERTFLDNKAMLEAQTWSEEALSGLLIRAQNGKPAWYYGLKPPYLRQFTSHLIRRLMTFQNMQARFQHSLEFLEGFTRLECQALLLSVNADDTYLQQAVRLIAQTPASQTAYRKAFHTWGENERNEQTIVAFSHHLFTAPDYTTQLITVTDAQSRHALALSLLKHGKDIARPVFYVETPEYLLCPSSRIVRDGNKGIVSIEPGGALYDFLRANRQASPVIVVNYDAFETDDLIRFNTLLDKEPTADGVPLPKGARVIGILNREKPDVYKGADFYSRFQSIEACPLAPEVLSEAIPRMNLSPSDYSSDRPQDSVLHLYHASDWKERLLGRWILDGGELRYQPGLLQNTLADSRRLVISGGLWGVPEFREFWESLVFNGGITWKGEHVSIPSDLRFEALEAYPWARISRVVEVVSVGFYNVDSERHILNPRTFSTYFGHQRYEGNIPVFQQGKVCQHAGQQLSLYLTRSLAEDAWAELLLECERYNVRLDIQCAPSVTLPLQMGETPTMSLSETEWTLPPSAPVTLVNSTCPDTTIAQITKTASWRVLDISECSADDLLKRVQGQWNSATSRFMFEVTDGALVQACSEGRNLVLRGTFNEDLLDNLAPLLLNHWGPGQIVLAGTGNCPFLPSHTHRVTPEEKAAFLPEGRIPCEDDESLARLQARSHYLLRQPDGDTSEAFAGLRTLPLPSKPEPFNPDTSETAAKNFLTHRRASVVAMLADSPMVYLAGLSGVGKSTFVRSTLCEGQKPFTDIAEWAKSLGDDRKILFIDEANLQPTDWSLFEGLFTHPPGILYRGEYYPLNPATHKVVFAGNPLSYGDERKLAPFFERHGRTVVFDALPSSVVYQEILKPLLPTYPAMAQVFLDVYDFLVMQSTTDVLITPRELEMMALLAENRMRLEPDNDPDAIARHYALTVALPLIPSSAVDAFKRRIHSQPVPRHSQAIADFIMTPSRVAPVNFLDDLLDLRTYRQTLSDHTPEALRFGGLNGLVIEGLPGVGKSELVVRLLCARGFREIHHEHGAFTGNAFVRMPASLSLDAKKRLLFKALHAGIVVIADEINASPMLESYLNQLLMGYDENHTRALKPGFLLIGTQNPASMGGRLEASTALSRRLITLTLPEYSRDEITHILHAKGVRPSDAMPMAEAFLEQLHFARQRGLRPEPGFRDLMRVAEGAVQTVTASSSQSSSSASGFGFFTSPIEGAVSSSRHQLEPRVRGR